jgi:hypothetical protein
MYCPINVAILAKYSFVVALPHVFYGVTKRVNNISVHNRKNVIRNCGMWVVGAFPNIIESNKIKGLLQNNGQNAQHVRYHTKRKNCRDKGCVDAGLGRLRCPGLFPFNAR